MTSRCAILHIRTAPQNHRSWANMSESVCGLSIASGTNRFIPFVHCGNQFCSFIPVSPKHTPPPWGVHIKNTTDKIFCQRFTHHRMRSLPICLFVLVEICSFFCLLLLGGTWYFFCLLLLVGTWFLSLHILIEICYFYRFLLLGGDCCFLRLLIPLLSCYFFAYLTCRGSVCYSDFYFIFNMVKRVFCRSQCILAVFKSIFG